MKTIIITIILLISSNADACFKTKVYKLKWQNAGTVEITGHIVKCGTQPGVYDQIIQMGPRKVFLISRFVLVKGVTYYFAVSAYNMSGISDDSDEVKWVSK